MGNAESADAGPEDNDVDVFTHETKLWRMRGGVVHTLPHPAALVTPGRAVLACELWSVDATRKP